MKGDMVKCPTCRGTKKVTSTIETMFDDTPDEVYQVECVTCDGTGEVSQELVDAMNDFWCTCGHKGGTTFFDDGENERCNKHCYACNDCGRLVQVG